MRMLMALFSAGMLFLAAGAPVMAGGVVVVSASSQSGPSVVDKDETQDLWDKISALTCADEVDPSYYDHGAMECLSIAAARCTQGPGGNMSCD